MRIRFCILDGTESLNHNRGYSRRYEVCMDPVILLTPKFSPDPESAQEQLVRLKESYFQAVTLAGGIPVLAGNADPKGYAQLADGLLLTGGIDIEPARYGQV